MDSLVSADSEEVKEPFSWLQLIDDLPSDPSNTDEQIEAAIRSEPDHPKPQIRGIRDVYIGQRIQDMKKNLPHYLEKLRACKSLEDFRSMTATLDANRDLKLKFSESAFRQVLHSGCGLETILQFLSDPSLNLQEARNLPRLWEWYVSEPRNATESTRLHNWLRRHISLGIQSKRELQDLVELASHSSRDTSGIQEIRDLHRIILGGLSLSGVDQISDLGGEILNHLLLASFDCSWQNPELQTSCFRILEVCNPAQLQNMTKGISSLLTSYLVSTITDKEIHPHDGQISKILDCLLSGSEIKASRAIASASQALLMRLRSSHPTLHLLKRNANQWWSLLLHHKIFKFIKDKSEWFRVERALARHNTDVLCLYLKHISDDEKCIFLLRHWFTQNVQDGNGLSPKKISNPIQIFSSRLISRNSQKCPFVVLFEFLGPRATIDRTVLLRLFSLLDKLDLHETSLGLYSYFLRSKTSNDFSALAKGIIDFTSPTPLAACTLYKITPFLPLESCPSVAEMMISTEGLGVPLGFRVLRRQSLGVSDVYPRTADEIRRAQIELLERMAMAYAQASHLHPRVALRQVYQCYRLLVRRHGRASLTTAFSRAFALAGLVKPLQERRWLGMTQLKFVLRIIREIEGDEVALKVDELLYIWRKYLIGEKAKEAFDLQLKQKLGLLPPEEKKNHTLVEMMIEAIKREEQRKPKVAASLAAGKPRGKLPGESNSDQLVRERTSRDVKFALAAQKAAMKKWSIKTVWYRRGLAKMKCRYRRRFSMNVLGRLSKDIKARKMANSVPTKNQPGQNLAQLI